MGMVSTLILLVVLAYLARWVASGWGERGRTEIEARHTHEIARLREEMDQLQAQVLRLTDEQSFLTRLLAEGRAPPEGELSPPEAAAPDEPNPERS
jgi:hypothetical protein